jgi:essential nuclear protein 1
VLQCVCALTSAPTSLPPISCFADVERDGDYVGARVAGLDASRLASEEEIMRRFMPDAPGERRTLADTIMAKLRESEEAAAAAAAAAGEGSAGDGARAGAASRLDARVVEVYTEVGRFLSKYKSGKVPKVLKIVPGLSNWEEVLFLTNPETWTPHATYAATRIFSSSFNAAKAQRFVALILLPKCRDDIYFHKRLNFHLYLALQKATYKPAAFFKGVILPLAAARDCTLREAVIFGSVLAKASLPQLHSAAALVKLAAAPYSGAVSVFLRVLVNKKYTLPYLAVDAVAAHFAAFRDVAGPLPLVWHQALLTAAQRYKADFTADQKAALRDVLAAHGHHAIAPEVRRELASAGCRGEAPAAAPAAPAAAAAAAAAAPAAAQARAAATAAASGPAALILAGAAAGRGRGAMAVDY